MKKYFIQVVVDNTIEVDADSTAEAYEKAYKDIKENSIDYDLNIVCIEDEDGNDVDIKDDYNAGCDVEEDDDDEVCMVSDEE